MAKTAPMRLQKALSLYGICSRRKAEELISQGKVKVNGHPAQIGMQVNPHRDVVAINDQRVYFNTRQEKVYLMLNKPRGYVTTLQDEKDRRCVSDLVEDVGTRVYPVGRLDRNSEGLLLLTNDGDFANAMMHPSSHVPKCYRVTVSQGVTDSQISQLCTGVEIDGRMTLPAQAEVLLREKERSVLEIVLFEGRNRQIRKMCEAVGLTVIRLKRVSIGGLRLGVLPAGSWRYLTWEELRALKTLCGLPVSNNPKEKEPVPGSHVASHFGKGRGKQGVPASIPNRQSFSEMGHASGRGKGQRTSQRPVRLKKSGGKYQ